MGQFSSFLKAWNGLRRANLTIQTHHFNPFKNQNYPPFFWNSSYVSSFRLPYTGLFLPCLLEPKELYSKWAKSDPKIVLYFTHRNGPTFGSKTDLFDLQCSHSQSYILLIAMIFLSLFSYSNIPCCVFNNDGLFANYGGPSRSKLVMTISLNYNIIKLSRYHIFVISSQHEISG